MSSLDDYVELFRLYGDSLSQAWDLCETVTESNFKLSMTALGAKH